MVRRSHDGRQDESQAEAARSSEAEYFQQIERHFGLRRGGPLLLSPRDWQLVQTWYERAIPLAVAKQAINRAFDRIAASAPESARINSLRYCEQDLESLLEEHRSAQVGGAPPPGSTVGLSSAAEHLRTAATACCQALGIEALPVDACQALSSAAQGLQALAKQAERGSVAIEELDARAESIEQWLLAQLAAAQRSEAWRSRLKLPSFSPYSV